MKQKTKKEITGNGSAKPNKPSATEIRMSAVWREMKDRRQLLQSFELHGWKPDDSLSHDENMMDLVGISILVQSVIRSISQTYFASFVPGDASYSELNPPTRKYGLYLG